MAFVEGPDDRRFVEKIFRPRLKPAVYCNLVIQEYARETPKVINDMLTGCEKSPNYFDYRMFADQDSHVDLDACRAYMKRRFPALDPGKVFMVRAEIESWYLAGLSAKSLRDIGIRFSVNLTDDVTKEKFDVLKPLKFRERRLFLLEILSKYNISEAKRRNISFRSFCDANQSIVSSG
jgi:hypothetical protein